MNDRPGRIIHASVSLTPGTRLGPYAITAQIGVGEMREVYKARDTRLDRTVAIKTLPEHVAADPELKQRFERRRARLEAVAHSSPLPRLSREWALASSPPPPHASRN